MIKLRGKKAQHCLIIFYFVFVSILEKSSVTLNLGVCRKVFI